MSTPVITTTDGTYNKVLLDYTNAYAVMASDALNILDISARPGPTPPPPAITSVVNAISQSTQTEIGQVNTLVADPTIKQLSLNILGLVTRLKAYVANPIEAVLNGILADSATYKAQIPISTTDPANDPTGYQAYNTLWCFLLSLRSVIFFQQSKKADLKRDLTDLLSTQTNGLSIPKQLSDLRVNYTSTLLPAEQPSSGVTEGTAFVVTLDGKKDFYREYRSPPMMPVGLLNTYRDQWEAFYTSLLQTNETAALAALTSCYANAQTLLNSL